MNKFECPKCHKILKSKQNLDYHLNKITPCNINVVKEDNDYKNFNYSKNKLEIEAKLLKENLDDCKCVYCEKKFSRRDSVIKHIKNNCKKVKEIEKEKHTIFTKMKELEEDNKKLHENFKDELNKKLLEVVKNKETTEKENIQLKKYVLDLEKKIELNNNINSDDDIKAKKTKKPKRKIPPSMRGLVWDKHIGLDKGKSKCLCCKETEITQMNFECGHIIAEACGGETKIGNLLPICNQCNKSMRTENLHVYQEKLNNFKQGKKI
jgi:hypothetical protein